MADLKKKFSFDNKKGFEKNIVLEILEALTETINRNTKETELFANIVTVTGTDIGDISYVLYLLPVYGNNYNYRYLELTQPIDNYFPIRISAFQSPPETFNAEDENQLFNILNHVYQDKRTQIIFSQLKNIGKTLKDWKKKPEVSM